VRQKAVRGFALRRSAAAAEAPATHQILWSGCKANQTSADAYFDGRYNGAFTYYFVKAMDETRNEASRATVLRHLRAAMKGHFSQVPQLEAHATRRAAPKRP
jgi:hypothetical protein